MKTYYFDKNVTIIAYVDKKKEVGTKNNDTMCFITGSDEISNLDIVLFPKTYEQYPDIKIGNIIQFHGKVEKRFDKYQLIVRTLEVLE